MAACAADAADAGGNDPARCAPCGNLFAGLPGPGPEQFLALLEAPGLRIERITSRGHASAPGFWYEQPGPEWVLLVAGAARLRFEDEAQARALRPGDYVEIAAGRRHRVDWTDPGQPTVWLAVHRDGAGAVVPGR